MKKSLFSLCALAMSALSMTSFAQTPALALKSLQLKKNGATYFGYFNLTISNYAQFPTELFMPAPNLPPCGLNTNSSRTWVSINDAVSGQYIYGFCALSNPSALQSLWFAKSWGTAIPRSVYVELKDRLTGRVYRSNNLGL